MLQKECSTKKCFRIFGILRAPTTTTFYYIAAVMVAWLAFLAFQLRTTKGRATTIVDPILHHYKSHIAQ